MPLPLEGLLVVSLEQAVAAPIAPAGWPTPARASSRSSGRRAISPAATTRSCTARAPISSGSTAARSRWCSISTKADDKALLEAMLAKADVFVQNLKPGALAKLGFAVERLRKDYPRLICCSISGYGESGPYAQRKAYDLLIQAESGRRLGHRRAGGAGARRRLGRRHRRRHERLRGDPGSADRARPHRRGRGDFGLDVRRHGGLDDGAAAAPRRRQRRKRIGLAHPSIAPYGVFKTRDGADILISIQNDREWRVLADKVLGDAALAADPNFATNIERVKHRAETDGTRRRGVRALRRRAADGEARGRRHRLRAASTTRRCWRRIRICGASTVDTPSGPVSYPAPAAQCAPASRGSYGAVPALGEHTEKVQEGVSADAPKLSASQSIATRFALGLAAGRGLRARDDADDQHQRDHASVRIISSLKSLS